jgi:glycopeptide antibiotics resistance protein
MRYIDRYLENLLSKIDCSKAEKFQLEIELLDHLNMIKKDYLLMGLTDEQAELLAIKDFGDEDFLSNNLNESYSKNNKIIRYFINCISFIYFAVLIKLLFLGTRKYILFRTYNIVPLKQIKEYINNLNTYDLYYNLLGNIILFIPLGFLIPFIFKKRNNFWDNILITLIFATTIESLQYILVRGAFDIDDIILYTIGSIIGYVIHKTYIYIVVKLNKYNWIPE